MARKFKNILMLSLASTMLLSFITSCNNSSNNGGNTPTNDDNYLVRLNYNDSKSRDALVEVAKGSNTTNPDTPVREGYEFSGWYTLKDGGDQVNFPYTPSADVTLYAHWEAAKIDVNYDLNYEGASIFTTNKIDYGASISTFPTEVPTRDNYKFRYWSLTEDGAEATLPINTKKAVTFYAIWVEDGAKEYTVTVNLNNGEDNKTYVKVEGESLTNKEITGSNTGKPTKTGYTFVSWATDAEGQNVITLPYTPTGDATLYAIYKKVEYKMTFKNNNNETTTANFTTLTFGAGDEIADPGVPTRAGYSFAGWYTLGEGGVKVDFPLTGSKVPTKNTTYYAHWKSNPVTTDRFEAEYVFIDPNGQFPGYSGAAQGTGIILEADVSGVNIDNYPTNGKRPGGKGYYLSYLYKRGVELTFNITATEAMEVELFANMAVEMLDTITIAPEGDCGYSLTVNGASINYSPITITGANENEGLFKCGFKEYSFGKINLNAGENIITFTTNNDSAMGGTTLASAPMMDYIRCGYSGSDKLSWSPIYDNLDQK